MGFEVLRTGENCVMRSFIICTLQKIILGSKMVTLAGDVGHIGEMRNIYKILVGMPVENTLLGRSRHRWEDNIKMDLKEVSWVDCIYLV
jgi:hypothetical protein